MPHPEILEALAEFTERFGEAVVKESIKHSSLLEEDDQQSMVIVRCLLLLILDSEDPKLTATIVARLTGLDQAAGKTKTMSDLGHEFGRTKQFISWYQRLIAERLNLPNNNCTPKARESMRLHAHANYGSPRIAAIQG